MKQNLIFFIHGLGGDPNETWGRFHDLILQDTDLDNYDVASKKYPTSFFDWPWDIPYPTIEKLVSALKTELEVKYNKYENIILVCHSLGGLIARKYLTDEIMSKSQHRIRGLLLYAVPNIGSDFASLLKMIPYRNNQLRQLCKDSSFIQNLNQQWISYHIEEKIPVRYVIAGRDQVVSDVSAAPKPNKIDLKTVDDKDHRSIVKPSDKNDLSYLILNNFLLTNLRYGLINPDELLKKYETPTKKVSTPRKASGARYSVIAFDLDGTLLQGYKFSWTEVWKKLNVPKGSYTGTFKKYGSKDTHNQLTFSDYKEWCDHDLSLLKGYGLKESDFTDITKKVRHSNNLEETLQALRNDGFILAIVSGGIDSFLYKALPNADELFDYICINRFHYDRKGVISNIEPTPFDFDGKRIAIEYICRKYSLTMKDAVFVGEGFNDEKAFTSVGLGIAYLPHSDRLVFHEGGVAIEEDNMLKILEHVQKYDC